MAEVDSEGNLLCSKTIGLFDDQHASSLHQLPDGSLIITGFTGVFSTINENSFIIKTDASGNVLWSNKINFKANFRGSEVLPDGKIISVGTLAGNSPLDFSMYLVKSDSLGFTDCETEPFTLIESDQVLQSSSNYNSQATALSPFFSTDIIDLEYSSRFICGDTITSVMHQGLIGQTKVYPVPATDIAYLEFNNPQSESYDLLIFDIKGRRVKTQLNIRSGTVEIDCHSLGKGIYFLALFKEGEFEGRSKLIVH